MIAKSGQNGVTEEAIDSQLAFAELIANARAVLMVTGAGISTASGIADFRGPKGIWHTMRPVPFDEFLRDPARRLEYWRQKLAGAAALEAARPNPVHHACVALEQAGKLDTLVTQNIDGLHALAGSNRERLVEIHGNAREVACLTCETRTPTEAHLQRFAQTQTPPRCECGGWLKPATISFGQALDASALRRASEAAERCDLVLALGSTLSVYPAAGIALLAAERGVPYAVINQGATDHDAFATLRLDADVVDVFPRAVAAAIEQSVSENLQH